MDFEWAERRKEGERSPLSRVKIRNNFIIFQADVNLYSIELQHSKIHFAKSVYNILPMLGECRCHLFQPSARPACTTAK